MEKRSSRILAIALFTSVVAACQTTNADDARDGDKPAATRQDNHEKKVTWHHDLETAIGEARRLGKPVLARATAKWCMWCRKLDTEIANADVQKELSEWVLVEIDTDDNPEDAQHLNIGPIPALRILTPDGRAVASREGFLTAAKLLAWLNSHGDEADNHIPIDLQNITKVDAQSVGLLVRKLDHRDGNVREAVIGKLSTEKGLAANEVVKSFSEGNLAARLATLELLSLWKAPVENIDPWQPDTVTDAAIARLGNWAKEQTNQTASGAPDGHSATPELLQEARQEIAKFLTADIVEAEAIAARLARIGNVLLPEVREQRERADSDKIRMRLDWLRYRLTASDSIPLKWPGGLMRLASTDNRTRRDAASQLSEFVGRGDESLLIELFSNPDPFVREMSLKALHGVDGSRATAELAKLLADPEPNVRAAVLKQLSEAPSEKLLPQISEYVSHENDPDLIVHAVRLLREIQDQASAECLIKLLEHPNWQVRAETVEALGALASNSGTARVHVSAGRRRSSVTYVERSSSGRVGLSISESPGHDVAGIADESETKESALNHGPPKPELIHAAVAKKLSDPDSFVVSRAVTALKTAASITDIDTLTKAAEAHPELAGEISHILLDAGNRSPDIGASLVKDWLHHENDQLRAAAVTSIFEYVDLDGETELLPALSDPSEQVRIAVAKQILVYCTRERPIDSSDPNAANAGIKTKRSNTLRAFNRQPAPVELKEKAIRTVKSKNVADAESPINGETDSSARAKKRDPDEAAILKMIRDEQPFEAWLVQFRSDQGRAPWLEKAIDPLQKMLKSDHEKEQIAAGVTLVALEKEELAIPILLNIARSDANQIGAAAKALGWLPWDKRIAYFESLLQTTNDLNVIVTICNDFVELRDLRASEPLWNLLSGEQVDANFAHAIFSCLSKNHRLPEPYAQQSPPPIGVDAKKIEDIAINGKIWQQRVALALLLIVDKPKVANAALAIYQNPNASVPIRKDAFCVFLRAGKVKEVKRLVVQELKSSEGIATAVALAFLTRADTVLQLFADGEFSIDVEQMRIIQQSAQSIGSSTKVDIPLLREIPIEKLQPLLTSGNEDVAGQSAYALALQGDRDGLDLLVKRWRKSPGEDSPWEKMLYDALATLDDPRNVPILDEIYRSMSDGTSEVKNLYWAIRSMHGPEVQQLRKKIRDEVGMQNLR